ncbi:MAG: glycosyltransferase family 9 protein [Candidatus Pacebacteria bacterium]|nr:glycosyltransferase family 9 protein [Candidatus Paceibacterota bacterium]
MIFQRLKNIFILFLCFFRVFFKGRANKKAGRPKKILVVQKSKLGDAICAIPVLHALKIKFPDVEICVLGGKIVEELLAYSPDFDDFILFENSFLGLVRKIKKEKFDFACVVGLNFPSLAALFLSGIPLISALSVVNGISPQETMPYKILKNFVVKVPFRMKEYAPREYLKLLEPIGIFTENTKKHLYFSREGAERAERFFSEKEIGGEGELVVGIAPSAGNKLKIWGGDKFSKLIEMILNNYSAKIILLGSGEDKKYIDELYEKFSGDKRIISACDLFSVDELKAFISRLDVLIGPDTGLMYVAEALDVSTIDIVGPVDETEQPPIGDKHKVIVSDAECHPCSFVMDTARGCKNKENEFVCFKKTTPETVFEAFKGLAKK